MTPTNFPILKPSTPAGKRAAELHQAWVDQYARVEQVDADHRASQDDLISAEAAVQDTLSRRELGDADDADVKAAEGALADATAASNAPRQEQAIAAGQAAERRRAEYEAFVNDNLDELVTELDADAKAAVDALVKGAEAFLAGFDAYQSCRESGQALISPAQLIDGQSIPVLEGAVIEAKAVVERFLEDRKGMNVPVPEERFLRWRRSQLADAPQGG
ncbi:MAG TPA: hypothetical protein VF125_06015 [Solirubrobacterales bacterium]